MKKLKKILICTILMFFISGCAKNSVKMDVKWNKQINLSFIAAIDFENENIKKLGIKKEDIFNDEELKKYEKNGFIAKEYNDGSYEGILITKNYKNIDEYSSNELNSINIISLYEDGYQKNNIFKVEKGFFKNIYTAKFNINEIDNFSNNNNNIEISNNTIDDSKFILSLPYKNISNNALDVENNGKTLIWDLNNKQNEYIEFSFPIYNIGAILSVGAGVIAFLILFLISTFNKPKKEQEIGVPNQIDVNSGLDSTVINEAKKDVLIDTNIG